MTLVGLLLLQLVAFAGLAAAAAGAGALWTRRLPMDGWAEGLGVAVATGLGALGSALFVLGLGGGLRWWPILILVCASLTLGAWTVSKRAPRGPNGRREAAHSTGPSARAAVLALLIALLPTFLWSAFPPTGFDATMYHLPFAQAFLESGRLVVVPELIYPVFPQLAEVLFAAMLAVTGADVTAHGVQFLALATTALLLYGAGRRFFSPWTGVWAAALWLAHPLVHYQGASGYVDLVLALFCVLAVYAWEVWRASGTAGWLILCGAAGGFAAATKYIGLIWLGLLVMLTLLAGRKRQRLLGAGIVAFAALLVAGPWYIRIWHETGNPVHPLLAPVFTDEAPSQFDRGVGLSGDSPVTGVVGAWKHRAVEIVVGPDSLPAFLWKASFQREAFQRQAPLAPWPLVLMPLAAVFGLRDRRLLRWVLLMFAYAFLWTTQDPRFQLPSAALMALAGAAAIHHLARRLPPLGRLLASPVAAWALAAILVAPGPLYAVYKVAKHGPLPPDSADARDAFLARELPGYGAVRLLNALHGKRYTLFAFQGEYLAYYADGRFIGDYRQLYSADHVTPDLDDAPRLHRELDRLGVDYFLVVHRRGKITLPLGATFDRHFSSRLQGEDFELFELLAHR